MKNVADIIDALGGNSRVAGALNLGASTVSEFKRRNSVPIKYWPRLIAFAVSEGTPLNEKHLMDAHLDEEAAQ